jgi:hypothetical protein
MHVNKYILSYISIHRPCTLIKLHNATYRNAIVLNQTKIRSFCTWEKNLQNFGENNRMKSSIILLLLHTIIIGTVIHEAHRMGGEWNMHGWQETRHIHLNYQSLSSYNFTLHNTGSFWCRLTKPTYHKQTRQLTARTSPAAALRQCQMALHREVRAAYLCLSYATLRCINYYNILH